MPIIAEKNPIIPTIIHTIGKAGKLFPIVKFFFLSKFNAIKIINKEKINFRESPLRFPANQEPNKELPATGIERVKNNFIFTDPRLIYASDDEIEVGTIMAREVPIAICVENSEEYPNSSNAYNKEGTNIMPPPTPKRPDNNPVKIPDKNNTPNKDKISGLKKDVCIK